MGKGNRGSTSKITSVKSDIEEEVSLWKTKVSEKEEEASILTLEVKELKTALNVFLGGYNARVGVLYVRLDKLKLNIAEYQHRINIARKGKFSSKGLQEIEEDVDETFHDERQKVKDLEDEASESYEEYERYKEEEKGLPLGEESRQELKRLWRKLALKFHPDRASSGEQSKEFNRIMSEINEAYKNGDLETLKKYEQKAEREEKIAKETPEEKLARLKEEHRNLLIIIGNLREELAALNMSESYKLREKVEQAREEGVDLLEQLASDIKEEIAENQVILDQLIDEYKEIIKGVPS